MPRCGMPSVLVKWEISQVFCGRCCGPIGCARSGPKCCMNLPSTSVSEGDNHSSLLFSEAGMQSALARK